MVQQIVNISVDNSYPYIKNLTAANGATDQFYIEGTTWDYYKGTADPASGPVFAMKEMVVYFERGGNYIKPDGTVIQAKANPNTTMTTLPNVLDLGDASDTGFSLDSHYTGAVHKTPGTLAYYPVINAASGGSHTDDQGIIINNVELSSDLDGDGFLETWSKNGNDHQWNVKYTTWTFRNINLADGPLTVHYVAIDEAGNATHFSQNLVIRNNPPIVWNLDIGTDLDKSGTISEAEKLTGLTVAALKTDTAKRIDNDRYDFDGAMKKPEFVVRNNSLQFDISTIDGNGTKTYRVQHVKKTAVAGTAITAGNVYTIVNPGETNWTLLGAPGNTAGTTFFATLAGTMSAAGDATTFTEVVMQSTTTANAIGTPSYDSKTTSIGSVAFIPANFGSTASTINDTIVGNQTLEDIPQADRNSSLFLITVTDSTEGNPLSFVTLVGLDVDNVDETPPKGDVRPFYWMSKDDNSLYENSKSNGHIELEGDLPTAKFNAATGILDIDPKVSGKISIRGTAYDNNLIDSLWVQLDGFAFGGAVADADVNFTGYAKAASYNLGAWTGNDQMTANGWKFTASDASLNQDGHTVNWQLDVDTSKVTGVAATDRIFRIAVRDADTAYHNPFTSTDTVQTTDAALTAYYRMDVVPYIGGVETTIRTKGGLKNNNIRSANGRYSIMNGEVVADAAKAVNTRDASFITVKGFNLNPTAVRIQSAAQLTAYVPGTVSGTTIAYTGAAAPYTSISLDNVATATKSGYLTVYTNGIGTLNNINANESKGAYTLVKSKAGDVYQLIPGTSDGSDEENMYNRDADRYTTKNITLTDDRYLQFYTVKKTDVKNGYYPTMMMNTAGTNPVFSYLDLKGGPATAPAVGAGGGAGSGTTAHPGNAIPQRAEFDSTSTARAYTEYLIKGLVFEQMGMARDESGRYLHATVYNYDAAGLELVYDRYAELWGNGAWGWARGSTYTDWPASGGTTRYRSYDTNNTAISLETSNFGSLQLDRFHYPKLITKGNSYTSFASVYMAYFDDGTAGKDLIFRTFQIGTQTAARNLRVGYDNAAHVDSQGHSYNTAYTNFTENDAGTGRITAASGASRYFDMAVTSTNRVIIAYYDEADGKLKLRYSSTAVDGSVTTGIGWTNSPVVLPDYVGNYVSMVIDSNDHLHIAAFDASDSDLKYIYVPDVTSNDNVKVVSVDQYGSVGNWTQIKLNTDGVPYIAYYNATETGGRDTIKLAYAVNPVTGSLRPVLNYNDVYAGVDANGYTTNQWEYQTVPAIDPPQGGSPKFQKVNLDFDSTGRPVLGYLGTNIEFSYPVGE
jgi:hypothetical protein